MTTGVLDRIGRWFRQSATGQFLGARIGAAYIRLVHATTRWEIVGLDEFQAAISPGTGVIAAIWHGRLFLSPTWGPKGRRTVAVISNNRDGDLISAIVWRFGVHSVRGSTYDREKRRDKGGAEVYNAALQELTLRNAVVAITPDGPRGPRMRAQRGVAQLAIETRLPVVPIAFSTVRGKLLRSWDRFLVPWPFGRGVQIFGAPIMPPPPGDDAAETAFLAAIETTLTEITNRADEICGRPPVTPGPAAER